VRGLPRVALRGKWPPTESAVDGGFPPPGEGRHGWPAMVSRTMSICPRISWFQNRRTVYPWSANHRSGVVGVLEVLGSVGDGGSGWGEVAKNRPCIEMLAPCTIGKTDN